MLLILRLRIPIFTNLCLGLLLITDLTCLYLFSYSNLYYNSEVCVCVCAGFI